MITFGMWLVAIALVLYLISMIGAIADGERPRLAGVPLLEVFKWFWEQLQKPIRNLTEPGLKWYVRTVSLGSISLLVGVFFVIAGVVQDDGDASPATTTPTTSAP